MLEPFKYADKIEAGCDEAGRGPLAGPVTASAVILPKDFHHPLLNDSKKLTEKQREKLRPIIEKEAIAWHVAIIDEAKIDELNILNASFYGMHQAVDALSTKPELLLIDGNRFNAHDIPHECIIKGDGKYLSIAAASVLAKTYRDEIMEKLHEEHPVYNWKKNKGYPTKEHRQAVIDHGISPYHRKSFNLNFQADLFK